MITGLAVILGAGIAGSYGYTRPPQYALGADLLLDGGSAITGERSSGEATERDLVTQEVLLASDAVALRAADALGEPVEELTVGREDNSDVITVSVMAASPGKTEASLNAVVDSYLALVAEQQQAQIDAEASALQLTVATATDELAQLDAAIAAADTDEQDVVIAQQAAQRSIAVTDLRSSRERLLGLQGVAESLPVNVRRLGDELPEPEAVGLSWLQWAVLGALVSGALVGLAVWRPSDA